MRDRWAKILPWIFLLLIAASRWPGLLPPNFSAIYALVFCAGAMLPSRMNALVVGGLLLLSDLALNLYYSQVKGWDVWSTRSLIALSFNYLGYGSLFFAGFALRPLADLFRRKLGQFGRGARWFLFTGGGLAAAILFYLITNTASWLFNPFQNPEYARNFSSWIVALTLGIKNHPQTWEFFRNSLFSSGIFAALFAGVWELTAAESPADKGVEAESEEEHGPNQPSESPA